MADTSTGSEHIHAFCWQAAFLSRYYTGLSELYNSKCRRATLSRWCCTMGDTVAATPAISIVILALKSEEPVSQIAVGFAFVALVNFGNQVHALALCFSLADTALRGAGQIRAYIQSTPQERDPEEYEEVPLEWPGRGQIQLSCVTAQYRQVGVVPPGSWG